MRERIEEMVKYLLCDDASRDKEIVDGYTDTFMLIFESLLKEEREEMMKLLPTNVETVLQGISNFSILEDGNYWPISETTYDKIQKLKELIKPKEK